MQWTTWAWSVTNDPTSMDYGKLHTVELSASFWELADGFGWRGVGGCNFGKFMH